MPDDADLSRLRATRMRYARLLLIWSAISILAAIVVLMLAAPIQQTEPARALLSAMAAQFLVWGMMDAVFAILGMSQTGTSEGRFAETLVRTLRFSFKLNFLLLAVGVLLFTAGVVVRSPALIGHGAGVITQIVFLIAFDHLFLRAMQRDMP